MTCAIYLTPKSWKPIATCKKWCRKNLNFLILIQANIVTHMTYAIYLTPKSLEPITTRKKWCKKTLNFQISIHANIVTHMTYAIYLTPKSLEPIATCEKWCKKKPKFSNINSSRHCHIFVQGFVTRLICFHICSS